MRPLWNKVTIAEWVTICGLVASVISLALWLGERAPALNVSGYVKIISPAVLVLGVYLTLREIVARIEVLEHKASYVATHGTGSSVDIDRYGVLAAIWVLSCIDKEPIMLFASTEDRLSLPPDFGLRSLIKSKPELFRVGVPSQRLEKWRERRTPETLPRYIRNMKDSARREQTLKELTVDDLFRSQFRTLPDAQKSPIEVIDWGLQHIERLRKAEAESREELLKKRQMWFTLLSGVVGGLVGGTLGAVGAIVAAAIKAHGGG